MGLYDTISNFFNGKETPKRRGSAVVTNSYNSQQPTLESFLANDSTLTEEEIMSIPAFKASMELITSSVAQLPIKLINSKLTENQDVQDDYRVNLLNYSPNATMNGFNFKKKIIHDTILYGSSKSYIEYSDDLSTEITAIYPFDMKDVSIDVYTADGFKKFGVVKLTNLSGSYEYYDDGLLSVLRDTNDGIIGRGIVEENDLLLRLALSQKEYETNLLSNGAMPTSVLETDAKMSDSAIARLREGWIKLYSGTKNTGKTVILENGLKYKNASLNPDTLQLTDSKKATIADIARIFNLPESMINSDANKYDSAEQNNLWFLQHTLAPYLVSLENALNHSLLTEEERQTGFQFRFDTTDLLRMTTEELTDITMSKFEKGLITNFQAKRDLGEKIEENESEYYKLTTGVVIYRADNGYIINPNTGATTTDEGEIIHEAINQKQTSTSTGNDVGRPTDDSESEDTGGTDDKE